MNRHFPVVNCIILKLASRCNIRCSYCYWFEDPLVLNSPKILDMEIEYHFLNKLEQHITVHQLPFFNITFHGGEPTLFPKHRFQSLCQKLIEIGHNNHCDIHLSIQTNGLLIDEEWTQFLKQFQVNVGISLDGDQLLHDKCRIDHKGRGTYLKTVAAINRTIEAGIRTYILAVASPKSGVQNLCQHLVETLGIDNFDVLIPQFHHQHHPDSIADYYCQLWDIYLTQLIDKGINIRILEGFLQRIVADFHHNADGLGYISTATLLTDGKLEATDDLRNIHDLSPSQIFIQTHNLQQVTEDSLWQEVYQASLNLCEQCQACEYADVCGGGPMVTRWSNTNRFNNPSVYCKDFKVIISHMQETILPHLQQVLLEKEEIGVKETAY